MSTIREPEFIAFDNGWEDGVSGRYLGKSPWFLSPIGEEVLAYYLGWKAGRSSVVWNLETDSPVTA